MANSFPQSSSSYPNFHVTRECIMSLIHKRMICLSIYTYKMDNKKTAAAMITKKTKKE